MGGELAGGGIQGLAVGLGKAGVVCKSAQLRLQFAIVDAGCGNV